LPFYAKGAGSLRPAAAPDSETRDLAAFGLPNPSACLAQFSVLGNSFDETWWKAATDVSGSFKAALPAIEKATVWILTHGAHLGMAPGA
jgi:hypothetical protein